MPLYLGPNGWHHSRRRRGAGGSVAPPFGSKRRKFGQIVYLFGQIFCLFGHTIGNKPSQFQWRPFFFFFFFFFLENTSIWTEKPENTSICTEKPLKFQWRPFFFFFGGHLNLGRKNRLIFDRETQCIKSFFGQKFGAPQIILSSYGHGWHSKKIWL